MLALCATTRKGLHRKRGSGGGGQASGVDPDDGTFWMAFDDFKRCGQGRVPANVTGPDLTARNERRAGPRLVLVVQRKAAARRRLRRGVGAWAAVA